MKLEERSRDLAEENLKKEITNCLTLLEVRLIAFGDYTFGHDEEIVNQKGWHYNLSRTGMQFTVSGAYGFIGIIFSFLMIYKIYGTSDLVKS